MKTRLAIVAVIVAAMLFQGKLAYAQGKTVSVKGYYRSNGTYVSPHTRSAPPSGFRSLPAMPVVPYYSSMAMMYGNAAASPRGISSSQLSPSMRTTARTTARTAPRSSARAKDPPYELRDWRDSDGKVIARARMKSRTANLVRLETTNGEPLEADVRQLSDIDISWLKKPKREAAPVAVVRTARPPFELRDWHDLEGHLIAHARMKSRAIDLIRLETADGEPLEADARQLSEEDNEWLEKAQRSPTLVYERLPQTTAAK
jgi:hypothetical protein